MDDVGMGGVLGSRLMWSVYFKICRSLWTLLQ